MLIELAPEYGISAFTASVLFENHPMMHVFRECGYKISLTVDAGVRELRIDLQSPIEPVEPVESVEPNSSPDHPG